MDALCRKTKVWIIDDSKLDRIIIMLSIQKVCKGASVMLVSSGKDALDRIVKLANIESGELPDVILLDLNMPDMSGWEFLDHLKALNIESLHRTRVFIVSGKISAVDVKKSNCDPFVANYFHKPISLDNLQSIFETG